ncbi:hypothetical protein [Streptomyces polygonati]
MPKSSTISDWFRGKSVPGEANEKLFLRLVTVLGEQAARSGYVPRPTREWMALLTAARGGVNAGRGAPGVTGPGLPIGWSDPHDLEVHPAGEHRYAGGGIPLPAYVNRAHDVLLAEAVDAVRAGARRMVVLVGDSSTGKTRACWEALRPLAEDGWRVWHPYSPGRAEAALEGLHRVAPRTVVWLNETQHYLGGPDTGERIAAALHDVLNGPQFTSVLVLGTLWPDYAKNFTALPAPGRPDPQSRVRELLAGRLVDVPRTFDDVALREARRLADSDALLAGALTRASRDGRVTQDLAGAPALLQRYEQASPHARAVLEAAMDARRLGVGERLPRDFVTAAAVGYLGDDEYDRLADDWQDEAFAELAVEVHGKRAPLGPSAPRPAYEPPGAGSARPSAPPAVRIAEYLHQHGLTVRRDQCPPASFWHAAHQHLGRADDLLALADAAYIRVRHRWANALYARAAEAGSGVARIMVARALERSGDLAGAAALYAPDADRGDPYALLALAYLRETLDGPRGPDDLYMRAADAGNDTALVMMALRREAAGDPAGAEEYARRAAKAGRGRILTHLAREREKRCDRTGAEALAWRAADGGNVMPLATIAFVRHEAGDREGTDDLARRAVADGYAAAVTALADLLEKAGAPDDAAHFFWAAAEAGDQEAENRKYDYLEFMYDLAFTVRKKHREGDHDGAEALARRIVDPDVSLNALINLAGLREKAGDEEGAERCYGFAADQGDLLSLVDLSRLGERSGDSYGMSLVTARVADTRNRSLLFRSRLRGEEGWFGLWTPKDEDACGADLVARARERERDGRTDEAEELYRQVADAGEAVWMGLLTARWPSGLEPDGRPTPAAD